MLKLQEQVTMEAHPHSQEEGHCSEWRVLRTSVVRAQVIESGNHEALLELQSVYYELFQKQLLEEEKVSP